MQQRKWVYVVSGGHRKNSLFTPVHNIYQNLGEHIEVIEKGDKEKSYKPSAKRLKK